GAVELPLGGVVLQQVREIVRRHDVAHGHDIECRAEKPLLDKGAEYEAADPAETIDSDFNCHGGLRSVSCVLIQVLPHRGDAEKEKGKPPDYRRQGGFGCAPRANPIADLAPHRWRKIASCNMLATVSARQSR